MMDLKNEILKYVVGIGPNMNRKFIYVLYIFHIYPEGSMYSFVLFTCFFDYHVLAVTEFFVYNVLMLRNVLVFYSTW